MAKQEAMFTNGRLGNVIFYRRDGVGYARTAASRVKQSKATKQSAQDFGRAVQLSRCLRSLLSPALPDHKSHRVMHKMNVALLKWLRQEDAIEGNLSFVGLEFNDNALFTERFSKELSVNFDTKGKVIISVPRLKIPDDIMAPSHTISVRLNIAVAGCKLELITATEVATVSIEIPYKNGTVDAVQKELKFNCKAGSINVVVASLHYITKENGGQQEVYDNRWTPAAIIDAGIV